MDHSSSPQRCARTVARSSRRHRSVSSGSTSSETMVERGRTTPLAPPAPIPRTCEGYQARSTRSPTSARHVATSTRRSSGSDPRDNPGQPLSAQANDTIQTPPHPGRRRWFGNHDSRPSSGPASLRAAATRTVAATRRRPHGFDNSRPRRPTAAPPSRIRIICSAVPRATDSRAATARPSRTAAHAALGATTKPQTTTTSHPALKRPLLSTADTTSEPT